jgi:hypothetical protein
VLLYALTVATGKVMESTARVPSTLASRDLASFQRLIGTKGLAGLKIRAQKMIVIRHLIIFTHIKNKKVNMNRYLS